jgi:hypothetical protein
VSGIDRIEPSLFFHQPEHSGNRDHNEKLHIKRSKLDVRSSFFSQRIVADWNSLPEDVVSKNLNAFKSRLDRFWGNEQYKIP